MNGLSSMELVICLVPAVFVIAIIVIVIYAIRPKPTTTTDSNSQTIAPKDSQASNDIGNINGISTAAETTQNGLATTSLVISILAIVIHFLLGPTWSNCMGPLAMLIGAIALLQIKKQGSKGKGIAIAGILLGTLPFIITLVSILLLSASSVLNK